MCCCVCVFEGIVCVCVCVLCCVLLLRVSVVCVFVRMCLRDVHFVFWCCGVSSAMTCQLTIS